MKSIRLMNIYRIGILIIIGMFLLPSFNPNNNLIAQETNKTPQSKHLGAYNYIEIVENADPTDLNIPLVIAVHWLGSNPVNFSKYIYGFEVPVRILLIEGPYPYGNGFSFYSFSPKSYYDLNADEKMAQLLKEGEKLSVFIQEAVKLYKPNKKPVIMGASQGGDLSYVIGIRYGDLISLACPLLATMDNRIIKPINTKIPNAHIAAFHGTADPIVSIDVAIQHIELLKENGYKAMLSKYEGFKHEIPYIMKKDYMNLISKTFK